ncbi:MAG: PmoA family protein [Phycisphaerae bacterium]
MNGDTLTGSSAWLCAAGLALLACGAQGAEKAAGTALCWAKTDSSLALKRGETVVWQYNYGRDEPKPHFHPLGLTDGTVLTGLRPKDHIWHLAGWFSWKYVNGLNYWETDKEGKSPGRTEIVSVTVAPGEDFSATIELDVSYHPWDKPAVLTEKRRIRVGAPGKDGGYHVDWTGTFTAGKDDVVLNRTPIPGQEGGKPWGGYAGLSIRMAQDTRGWAFLDSEGRSYSVGKKAKTTHGLAARWIDCSGKTKSGATGGVAMFDHPGNIRHPSKWSVFPNMPYFSPAMIFDGPHTIPATKSLTLRYRIVVHAGPGRKDELEKMWQAFAKGAS